jgi:rhamnose transport system substrate-binding protein
MGRITPRRDEVSMQVALPVLEFTRDNVDKFRF